MLVLGITGHPDEGSVFRREENERNLVTLKRVCACMSECVHE